MAKTENNSSETKPRPHWQFKPGQSGNPGGRPKGVIEVIKLAQETTEASIAALIRVRDDPNSPPAAVVSAAQALLDRGWGKPTQPTEISGKDGGSIKTETTVNVPEERPSFDAFMGKFQPELTTKAKH